MSPSLVQDYGRLLPDYILSVGATIVLIVGALSNDARLRDFLRWLSLIFIGSAGFALALQSTDPTIFAGGWLFASPLGNTFALVFLGVTGWIILANPLPEKAAGEWYSLFLFAAAGMLILARAGHLGSIFMGVEILSVCLYILIAFYYKSGKALAGAIQYLVLAGFASAFLAFGLALVYAGTGTMSIPEIQAMLGFREIPQGSLTLTLFGVAIFLVGVGFKLSAVPFHLWAGDVYEASTAPVASLIASASKGATFAALLPFFVVLQSHWIMIWVLAAASMLLGNLLALRENRLHRILGYSSIAHVGYLLTGFLASEFSVVGTLNGPGSILFYVAAYSLATVGAFGVLSYLSKQNAGPLTLRDLRSVAKQSPGLAFALMVFVVSMSGLPPSLGFHGKLFLFSAAYAAGFKFLVLIGLIGSAIGLFYYLRIVMHLYMMPSDAGEVTVQKDSLGMGVLTVTALAAIILGLVPGVLLGVLSL